MCGAKGYGFLAVLVWYRGRFPFSQNFRNFRFGGKWNSFRRFVPLENFQKKWKKKVVPFSRLEFPNGMSCSIYVSLSLYQFQVHGRAPPRTGVFDQMEQLFTNRKFHFCHHRNFRVFFLNGKRPGYQCWPFWSEIGNGLCTLVLNWVFLEEATSSSLGYKIISL